MLRRLIASSALVALAGAQAAVWPDPWGDFRVASRKAIVVVDQRGLWEEYGLEEAEQVEYESPAGRFRALAYRLKDSTGALAAWQWKRPAGARPSKLATLAVETATDVTLAYGNYFLQFQGHKPQEAQLSSLVATLPRLEESPPPPVSGHLPVEGLVSGSERFTAGPVALQTFEPRIPPSVAGFHFGVEGQLGTYRTTAGEMGLTIFSYPTPHIARERLAEFQKISGAIVKRSGSLLAVILSPPNADDAERLLARVNYRATVTLNEPVAKHDLRVGELLIGIFAFAGVLSGMALLGGLMFGVGRATLRKWSGGQADVVVIELRLGDK